MQFTPYQPLRSALLTLAMLAISSTATPLATDTLTHYEGVARAPHGGAILYREAHFVRHRSDHVAERLVIYTCADGRPFARKQLNYETSRLAPDLDMTDARVGFTAKFSSSPGHRILVTTRREDKTPTRTAVPADGELVVDAGFNELLQQRWDALVSGHEVPFQILLLGSGSIHGLRARRVEHVTENGEEREHFRVELGGLLGLVAPSIDVWYSTRDRVLRRYEGVSNLRDESGHQIKAVIDFPIVAPSPASDVEWQREREMPLVSSCNQPP